MHIAVTDVFQFPRLQDLAARVKPSEDEDEYDKISPISPFSLLDLAVDHQQLCRRLEVQYALKGTIEDLLPCTPLQEGT